MAYKTSEKYAELFGKTFGKLTILPLRGEGNNKYKYYCKCECGNEKWIRRERLLSNSTKSCGCYLKEVARELQSKIAENNFKDLSGQQFGRLLALSCYGKDNTGNYTYLCKCDRGNQVVVVGDNLKRKITKSCGCIHIEVMKKRGRDYRISVGKDPDILMSSQSTIEHGKFNKSDTYKKILKRDNYTCQLCSGLCNLEIHHILSWTKYPELRYEETNIITLCKICHNQTAHSGNTFAQMDENIIKMLQHIIKRKYEEMVSE